MNLDDMRNLVDKLNYYTKLYDEGNSPISDKEWDNMYFELDKMEQETGVILSNSPTVHIDYTVKNALPKVNHNHPMLSLQKTKNEEEIVSFLKDHNAIAMAKMDGLTCSIKYEKGCLVSAETRGNGLVGEDITHNIVWAKGVPMEIPIKDDFIVDGEIICTYEDFEDFSATYKNPRNFASGSIRLLDSRESAQRRLTFVAWDCIAGLACKTLSEKLFHLGDLGFIVVPYIPLLKDIIDLDHIKHTIILLKEWIKEPDFQYPIDGIVFKFDDCDYYQSLGATDHHFRGGIAFKFYDEEYETRLRNIEWSMGKTGQLTPVAIFDPVDDGESIVERASLHNLNIMKQILGHPYCNQSIKVVKQNQIIPQIVWGDKKDEDMLWYFDAPETCPICGEPTYIKDDFVYCSNSNCEGRLINRLDHYAGKKGLDIKGLSKATLEKLINWGWLNSISDIYKLQNYRNEWIKKPGFGPTSVDKTLATINERKNCELWQFIAGLSIPLIGINYAKEIAKHCIDWQQFMNNITSSFNFTKWDTFGYETNKSLHSFNYDEANELANNILTLSNSLWIDPEDKEEKTTGITNKTFCITGAVTHWKNRGELSDYIVANGGKVVSSISKNTNYLINNDITSQSSKNVKAKSLNIPIITEDQLLNMI